MEPEGSLSFLENLAIGPYSEPEEPSPDPYRPFI
jgi:hypothetical protein